MNLIASLPWYDHPGSASELDLFWDNLRSRLIDGGIGGVPTRLNRSLPLTEQWRDAGLLLSQCCGPDLFTEAAASVNCLGRPVFSELDCQPGSYYSHIVSQNDLVSNPAIAINSPTSWSGNRALRQWLAERGENCSSCVVSGSHQRSLDLLLSGTVDLVAIDAHAWRLLDSEGVKIIGRSDIAATPPFITGIENPESREIVRTALTQTIASIGNCIGISELLAANEADYAPIAPEYRMAAHDDSPQKQFAALRSAQIY